MLFWLQPLLTQHDVIFDWGGHLGLHYYAYSHYLTYPVGLKWIVCEVPRLVAAGIQQTRARGDAALRFTTNPSDADGADILIAAGSIQYVQAPTLPTLLTSLSKPPPHLLLNKLPLYAGDHFVTLQNASGRFVPLHVWNRSVFVGELLDLGYHLIDEWEEPERPLLLPTYPDRSFDQFTGMYLRKRK